MPVFRNYNFYVLHFHIHTGVVSKKSLEAYIRMVWAT